MIVFVCCIGKWNPNECRFIDILKTALMGLEVAILVRCPVFLSLFIILAPLLCQSFWAILGVMPRALSSERASQKCSKVIIRWLGGITVRTLDLLSRGCQFSSRFGRYQVVTTLTWTVCVQINLSQYITNTKVNSAFHPSMIGKSSTCLLSWS